MAAVTSTVPRGTELVRQGCDLFFLSFKLIFIMTMSFLCLLYIQGAYKVAPVPAAAILFSQIATNSRPLYRRLGEEKFENTFLIFKTNHFRMKNHIGHD